MTDLELFIEDTKERLDEKAYNDFMQMCRDFDMALLQESMVEWLSD